MSRPRRWLRVLGLLGLACTAAGTLLVFSARSWWFGEVACNFRLYLGLLGLVPCAMLGAARAWSWAAVALGLVVLHAGPVLLLYAPDGRGGATGAEGVTLNVAAANLLIGTADPERFGAWVAEVDPDVLCVLEVRPPWYGLLAAMGDEYPHRFFWPPEGDRRERAFGMAILSRHPLGEPRTIQGEGWPRPLLVADVAVGERSLRLVLVHPMRAGRQHRLILRNACLARAGELAAGHDTAIVIGDLNATAYSPVFEDLLSAGGLRDSRRGFGWLPTWWTQRPIPGLWLPLDHVLVGPSVEVEGRGVGPDLGSDHLPIQARLRLPELGFPR